MKFEFMESRKLLKFLTTNLILVALDQDKLKYFTNDKN